ncbi:MAG: sulfotransferase [Candidatus Limnocylindrales bacterium]
MSRRISLGRLARGAASAVPGIGSRPLQGGAVRSRYDQLQPLPQHPPDWQTGPPDFVIIGAQKSGTTWWQGLIESHLDVARPPGQRRELHFFDHFWDRWPTDEQLAHYRRYFPRPTGSLVGEKTPGYLYQPWVAPMLAQAAPAARLIVLMRDPVDRFISGLGLLQRSGSLKGEVGAGEVGMREHRIVEAIDRGRYADQLAWWLKHFPREQLLLLQYEACVADPQGQLTRTFEFLGLPDQRASVSQISQARKKASGHVELPAEMRALLAARFADDLDRLEELMPDFDRSLWKSCTGAAR